MTYANKRAIFLKQNLYYMFYNINDFKMNLNICIYRSKDVSLQVEYTPTKFTNHKNTIYYE